LAGAPARAGIAAIDVDPKDSSHVAAATYWYGVYLSTDAGATWNLASTGMPNPARQRLDDVDFAPDGTLYASSHHGIWTLETRRPCSAVSSMDGCPTREFRTPQPGLPCC
jgi:hypothetical protein